MAHQFSTSYISDSVELFRHYKKLAERAMAQCPEPGLLGALDGESNSHCGDRETHGGEHAVSMEGFFDDGWGEAGSQPGHGI